MSHIDAEDSLSMIREKALILNGKPFLIMLILLLNAFFSISDKRTDTVYSLLPNNSRMNRSTKTPILSVHLQNRALVSASVLK